MRHTARLLAVIAVGVLMLLGSAAAEVFMYKDSAGKWHGVSSPGEVPEEYRAQVETVNNPDTRTPEQIVAREKEYQNELAEKERQQKQKAAEAIEAAKEYERQQERIKAELPEAFNQYMYSIVGTRPVKDWQLTDYKVVSSVVNGNKALITVKVTASNDIVGDRNFTWEYSAQYINGWRIKPGRYK